MIHVHQKAAKKQAHPLFKDSEISSPLSSQKPQYLLLPNYASDPKVHKKNECKYISPAFDNETNNSCYIVLEGESLQEYLLQKINSSACKVYGEVLLTEQEIWELVHCLSEAFYFLKIKDASEYLTHFKQYSIRVLPEKNIYKLIYHGSMISQLESTEQGIFQWYQLYLSPEQLNGQFIPQKSIIFSLGLLLLNLCAYENKKTSIYELNQFKVNTQAINEKLKFVRQTKGYSKILCNLLRSCLTIEHSNRYDFQELRDVVKRKRQRKFDQQSLILSEIMQLQKNKNVTYDLIFPSDSQYSYDPNNTTKTNQKTRSEKNSYENKSQKKDHFQQSAAQKSENEESEKCQSKVIKLKKKISNKFEGSKVVNKDFKSEAQGQFHQMKQKLPEKVQEQIHQIQVDPRFLFRGTFGARTPNYEFETENNSTIKKRQEDSNHIPKDGSSNKKNINFFEKQNPKKQTIAKSTTATIPKLKSIDDEQLQKQQVDTPKGFGKTKPFNPFSSLKNSQIETEHIKEKEEIQILTLKTQMKYLNLEYCLKPVEEIIQDLGKVGVWVEGDLFYGDFLTGRRYGLGLEIFTNGEYYYGFFKDDLFCGEGLYFWTPTQYFFGYFQLGQKVYGRLEGEVQYQGEFKNNKRHGFGTCWYPSGQIYSGQWLNGKKHGRGLIIEPNGLKFRGTWAKGKRKGEGELEMDSMSIKGFWNEQVVEGQALINYQNGDVFQGIIGKNLQKINGKYTSKSGRVFVGQFENDESKYGQLIYSNGDKYIGELKNGKRNGYGVYYYLTGEVYKGLWENNLKKQ